jgi:signal transduction histidine kinase
MVATFLDLDRLYRTGSEPQRRPVEIANLVRRAVEDIDFGDHILTIDAATATIQVDPDQVERILENLLANAVAHTPAGTPLWLCVSATSEVVEVTVGDAGPGLPDELKERVFELFSTADPQARRTGVGLWVVRRLAELHGGRAWVEDRPGGGASFRVVLPADGGKKPLSV